MSTLSIIGARAIDQAALRARMEVLTRQVATGQRGAVHGDLGAEAGRAIDLRGGIARREAYAAAASRALARSDTTQTVLGRLQEIAAQASADAKRAKTLDGLGVESLARTARAALEEAAILLNTQQGGEYLFSGSDVGNPAVPEGAAIAGGSMATAIGAAVATLDPTNAATVLAATATAATDPASTPFSAFLEGPGSTEARRAVQVADGDRVAIGVFANRDQADAVTTSWGRELLRGLATLAALTPANATQGTGWTGLLDGVAAGLDGAANGVAAEQAALGASEQRIAAAETRQKDTLVALRSQLGAVEEVDLETASTELRMLQTRLEASYRATSLVADLSLASLL